MDELNDFDAFGEIDIDDIPEGLTRGTYKFDVEVTGPYTKDDDDDNSEVVSYRIQLSVDLSHDDFGGLKVSPIFVKMYPKMTQEKFDKLPKDLGKEPGLDRTRFRRDANFYRAVLRRFGIPDDEIKRYNIMKLDGTKVHAEAYYDKSSGESRINSKTLKPIDMGLEEDTFDDFS